jgi:peptidyl-prolyl cis-trans isomerase A (cyclophilin A)
MMRFFTRRAAAFTLCLGLAAAALPALAADKAPKVRFSTTDGDFIVELYPDKAPKTVDNFLRYVKDHHYDGTIFHRVIDNFMIQGGGYDQKYNEKPTRPPVPHEGREAITRGGPKNVRGTIAMARTSDPNSATAQFFINVKDNAFLDPAPIVAGEPPAPPSAQKLWGYTVFGKVVSGMDVIDKIKSVATGPGGPFPSDVPRTPVVIKSATIVQ